jgi:uncharacterized protein YjiS (DUF1127 family)
MNGMLAGSAHDPCFDPAALRARPAAELWGLWLGVGRALLVSAGPPLAVWRQRARERRMLAYLTERDFKDMRMTPQDVRREINKPFWRA